MGNEGNGQRKGADKPRSNNSYIGQKAAENGTGRFRVSSLTPFSVRIEEMTTAWALALADARSWTIAQIMRPMTA